MEYAEQNTIVNLKSSHESFPKVNPCWDVQFLNNVISLRRKLMTFDSSHESFQVITICEDENTELHNSIWSINNMCSKNWISNTFSFFRLKLKTNSVASFGQYWLMQSIYWKNIKTEETDSRMLFTGECLIAQIF